MLSLLDSSQKARTKLKSDIRNAGLQCCPLDKIVFSVKKKKKNEEDLR